jgi:hypothetical protein
MSFNLKWHPEFKKKKHFSAFPPSRDSTENEDLDLEDDHMMHLKPSFGQPSKPVTNPNTAS